jgi:predicted methyltransferase
LRHAAMIVSSLIVASGFPNGATGATDDNGALKTAVAGPQRTAANAKRDTYRHPLETLEFLGVRSDQRVIEVLPGGGWYTEILAPLLKDKGELVEATPSTSTGNPNFKQLAAAFEAKLASNPEVYGKVKTTPFEPPTYVPLGPPGSADRVVTFRNVHDFIYFNIHGEVADDVLLRFFRSAYEVLKPGGVLGITDHRARSGEAVAQSIRLGRVPQDYIVREARLAGFETSGTSEVNANPKDDKTFPEWNLPPLLKAGDQDRAKYIAIGEADEMMLRFTKPIP